MLELDDSYVSHPKVAALTDRQFRVWFRLLSHCSRRHDPRFGDETVGEVAQLTPAILDRFLELRLVDRNSVGYEVHDWPAWNAGTVAERVAWYVGAHPDAPANEVQRAVRGRRVDVLDALKQARP